MELHPGSVVKFRNREWILLPSPPDTYRLRPLTGTEDEAVEVHKKLALLLGGSHPTERISPARFPPPDTQTIGDASSVYLFWQAARLLLREGAAPFRSFGRISVEPRPYQLVPLLMALRLDPVRILIADDVGVGKTIEAGLIIRELWDRAEIQRFAVLAPPYLCDQWHKELSEKFHFEPVVITSGTLGRLERRVPQGRSIYEYYPVQVISIDFIKGKRNKHLFLEQAPELIVVDEVHGAVPAGGRERHLRYELVSELAAQRERHLLLLTATPHSGIQEAFQKLLGLLDPEFEVWDFSTLDEPRRTRLARHFIQRTRADIKSSWNTEKLFPKRDPQEREYRLSSVQRELYDRTHRFCQGIVRKGKELVGFHRRMRYWSALALLRCVMSSPQAALAALHNRLPAGADRDLEYELSALVFEPTDEHGLDEAPAFPIDGDEGTEAEALRRLAALARSIAPTQDTKLQGAIAAVKELLQEGFNPIVWCFFVDTAEYVARELRKALSPEFKDLEVLCVTGRMDGEERRAAVEELMKKTDKRRVLVATDCLSEGINLQEGFDAVLHYDLPWNPNRLEQREGRVDRFGQKKELVRVVRYYGSDNPVDGAILRVLLEKAWKIHRILGTYVPVPVEEETVIEALINALFTGPAHRAAEQMALEFIDETTKKLHDRWDLDVSREKESRTRFAQRRIKPQEVQRELKATDQVLGNRQAVRNFVLTACQRLGIHIEPDPERPGVWRIPLGPEALVGVPDLICYSLPSDRKGDWRISFHSPTPEGAEFVGRNHRFVASLAQYLFELALEGESEATTRCGAIRTDLVNSLTTLFLLRVRYLLKRPGKFPLLSEEVLVLGQRGFGGNWLPRDETLKLLAEAKPVANLPLGEKRELVKLVLSKFDPLLKEEEGGLGELLAGRARELEESHKRVRRTVGEPVRGLSVRAQWPPDLLGILVLQPFPRGEICR